MTQAIRSNAALGSLPPLSFVLGGARSGKSAFAESLCLSAGLSCVYLATSQAWDDEMRDRIASHRDRRDARWQTIEEPLDLPPVLDRLDASQIVLLDCATLWLTNHLLAEHDLEAEQTALLAALARCAARVVVVSNEVGLSIVPENALARRFRDARWQTIEEPLDLPPVLDRLDASQVVLLDCATLWLTNHLLAEHDLEAEQTALVAALARCAARVVVVSNEVGLSIVPENALARRFRDAQGRLNQALAAQAGLVVAVWAGLPLVLKGQLP